MLRARGSVADRERGIVAAHQLADSFEVGNWPAPLSVPVRLPPGEVCYATGPVQMQQMLEGEGTYVHKSRIGFGMLGIAMVAATAVGNGVRKARAAREAAPQWRAVGRGTLFLTDQRFAIQNSAAWSDIWFENIRMTSCDGAAIELQVSGIPPLRLLLPEIDYFYVMFYRLAFGQVIRPPFTAAPAS